jgi:cell division protein FtsQ
MRFLTGRRKPASAKAAPRRPRHRFLPGRRGLAAIAAILALGGGALGAWHVARSGEVGRALLAGTARLGLAVGNIEVIGRHMTSSEAILRTVGARRGTPILGVSPEAAKTRLEGLPWVRSASVERRLPDTLRIRLVEREPFALWQRDGKLALIDRDGTVITDEKLGRFPGLVVLVGDEAPRRAAELMEMLAGQPELARRVAAAVLVGGRRWNIRLDNGIDIELPESGSAAAWAQLARLERRDSLLARDIQVVDMRLPDRLVVRVTPEPPKHPAKKGRQAGKST